MIINEKFARRSILKSLKYGLEIDKVPINKKADFNAFSIKIYAS